MSLTPETRLKQLDLNLLTVLDALLREQSVTRAADSLGTTQSAISHSLGRLRAFFDDSLFVKASQGMVPTRKAELLRQPVVAIMAAIRNEVLAEAGFDPARSRRAFVFAMTDVGELVFLPPLLTQLRKAAPGCTVRTVQVPIEQIEGLLASGEVDLALGSIKSAPEGLYRQRLFMNTFVTIVSASNTSIGENMTLEQFRRTPQVVVSLEGKPGTAYDNLIEEQGVERNVFLTTPHFLVVPLLLERQPDLIATVPMELANAFARYGTVRILKPPVELPQFALDQHWHPRFHNDPAVVWLRTMVKQTFEQYAEPGGG
ncbi:LysR family transcriptional regulator [Ramlibacter rhizophilus]|uniref:LysR family transcriptional regulator n=1 Tax=Ramlibacter rhizophilus TaxID=1781167 RepID=A0A4Z0BXN6_9BURK|nr:LysR family transcriptional regulator [Ramlibacter rhizophilus]TFZ03462.1 LysR family transcriptional regulator [Ramlibacter rhizophilus]